MALMPFKIAKTFIFQYKKNPETDNKRFEALFRKNFSKFLKNVFYF